MFRLGRVMDGQRRMRWAWPWRAKRELLPQVLVPGDLLCKCDVKRHVSLPQAAVESIP